MSNRHFAVIGDPITHSLSPFLHQTAFDIMERTCTEKKDKPVLGTYVAYQVKKEDLTHFMDMFCGRESTRVFRPLCLLKEGESYANNLREGEPFYKSELKPMNGLSITLPHKKEIMQYADKVTPLALLAGAANTLYWDGGKLVAHNTDVEGFLSPLYAEYAIATDLLTSNTTIPSTESPKNEISKTELTKNEIVKIKIPSTEIPSTEIPSTKTHDSVNHSSENHDSVVCNTGNHDAAKQTAMILGAGGAAAAVLVGLLQIECIEKIYLCARNMEQAKSLWEHLKKIALENSHKNPHKDSRKDALSERLTNAIFTVPEILPFSEINKKVDLVVNTIPATLNGQSFNPRNSFDGVSIAYDLLYSHTPFLQAAKEQGVRIINGGEMFLQQGAKQFRLWTGREMPGLALEKVKERIALRTK